MSTEVSMDEAWNNQKHDNSVHKKMLLPPIKQLPKDNPAKAAWDANDAEEKAALGLAQAPKLDDTVGGEGVEGVDAEVVKEVSEKEEQHGGRR